MTDADDRPAAPSRVPEATGAALPSPPDWQRLSSRSGPDLYIFQARIDTMRNPRTGRAMERVTLETPDWVNVMALTPEREILIVRQYRFGSHRVSTEIPAGMVEADESHEQAARRELLEETGYAAERWTYLGSVEPNPAFHDNRCHHWLAEGARRVTDPAPDGGEDIRLVRMPLDTFHAMLLEGRIDHSLVVSAASHVLDLRRRAL
ncbi:MAG: NUDIX hydrolase [Chloroflexi bacterium]|nr:NUDIX hydrolase [Chloroflexota bacterium]